MLGFTILQLMIQLCITSIQVGLSLLGGLLKLLWWIWQELYRLYARHNTQVLGPGAKHPSGVYGDTLDYRSLAKVSELPGWPEKPGEAQLRLGQLLSPGGKQGEMLFLPGHVTRQHVCLFGPPGSGKTEGFISRWIEDFIRCQSVFVTDAKGNLNEKYRLADMAQSCGAQYFEWSLLSRRSHCWNLCEEVDRSSPEAMLREVSVVAKALMGKIPKGENECFWYRDLSWLKAGLILLLETEVSPKPSQLLSLLLNPQQVEARLGMLDEEMRQLTHNLMVEYFKLAEWDVYKALFTLRDRLSCFDLPNVRRICDGKSDFRLQDFNRDDRRFLLVVPQLEGLEESKQLARVMSALFLSRMMERYQGAGGAKAPIAFIADEAHALKDTIDFEQCLAVLREANVSMVVCTQSLSQFQDLESREMGQRIAGMCRTKILLPGVDVETARWFSESLGERPDASYSVGRNLESRVEQRGQRVARLSPREIIERPPGLQRSAIVRDGTSKPFLVKY